MGDIFLDRRRIKQLEGIITLESIRNVLLVYGGLRPAAILDFACLSEGFLWIKRESLGVYSKDLYELNQFYREARKEKQKLLMRVEEPSDELMEEKLIEFLKNFNIKDYEKVYTLLKIPSFDGATDANIKVPKKTIKLNAQATYSIAKDEHSLENLMNAQNDYDFGIALGYPKEVILPFIEMQKEILEPEVIASNNSVWTAYVDWVFYGKTRCPSIVKKVGRKYQKYITKKFPEVAEEIDSEFYGGR